MQIATIVLINTVTVKLNREHLKPLVGSQKFENMEEWNSGPALLLSIYSVYNKRMP